MTALHSPPAPLASERSLHPRVRRWVLAACAVWLVLAIVPYLPPLAPHRWPRSPRLIVISLVALAQASLLFAASRRRDLGRRLQQAIALLAAAMLLVAVSDTLVVLFNLGVSGPALQGINDFLELAYSLLGIAALLWMPLAPLRRDGRWLVTLDIAIAVGGMAIVLFVTTTMTGVAAAEPGAQSRIIQYALITTGTLVALNIILVRGLARPVSLAVLFLAGTAVIEVVYWVIVQLSLAHLVSDMRVLDVVFAVDQVCYALAGLAFLTAPVEPGRRPLLPDWMREVNPLPAIAIVAVGVMLTQRMFAGVTAGIAPGVIGLVVLSLLMVARVMLAARDRALLVRLELATERRMQADRVLAIRRLAGGIAHEFNNLMTVVVFNADDELRDAVLTADSRRRLEDILASGQRAADLTARLRTYAGGESRGPRPSVRLQDVLDALASQVRSAAGDRVSVHFDIATSVGEVSVERQLIEQCVLNLVRNSAAAMPAGGDLSIRLSEKQVAHDQMADAILPAPAGRYAVIEVRDSGSGIEAERLQRIFDPFYTSQSLAVASGLGLAMVHGAMASHGGGITVSSAPGDGTAIRLFIPVKDEQTSA
ncbi:MAG: sensor histidine kinase [Gemmatimonadales bacterium]